MYIHPGTGHISGQQIIEFIQTPVFIHDFLSIFHNRFQRLINLRICPVICFFSLLCFLSRISRFASHSSAGIGVDSPYKMQFAINERGALFVIWAAICAGFGKLFGKRGVFYEMVGQEVSGLDGFYDHEFQEYGEFGIRIPENPGKVCDEIEAATGVQAMIVDANDLNVEILGKASSITLDDETLKGLIRDNPAGQSRELTPFILIREVKEEGETA